MKNFIKTAQANVASQLLDSSWEGKVDPSKIERILLATALAAGVSFGLPVHDASAANNNNNNKTFAKVMGASLGAFAGAKLGKNKPYAERAAIMVAAGAAGTLVADSLSSNPDHNSVQQYQRQRRAQVVESWSGQTNGYTQSRNINQNISNNHSGRYQSGRPELLSPSDFDMPPLLIEVLKKSGNLGMVRSENSHQINEDAFRRMSETTRSLSRTGQVYAEAKHAWDSAQLLSGVEGVNARTQSAEMVASSLKIVQSRAEDWLNVRNALAVNGVNVSSFDNAIRSDLSRIQMASSYDYRLNANYRPR